MRVMTTRPNPFAPRSFGPAIQIRSAVMAAVPLALIDPGAARVLLQQLEDRSGQAPAKLAEDAGSDWLRAWALVDLEKAEWLLEAQLTALEGRKNVKLQNTGIFRMIDILVLPPQRRFEKVFQIDGTGRPVFEH
jgi:hypothetical protein